jgi:hypothetical protein
MKKYWFFSLAMVLILPVVFSGCGGGNSGGPEGRTAYTSGHSNAYTVGGLTLNSYWRF